MNIACIDDNPTNNLLLEKVLGREYPLQSFFSAEEFLNQPDYLENFDLLLVDIDMPGLNGFELTQKLREEGANQPIILISGITDLNARLDGYDAGCDDYICKPFSMAELKSKIRVWKNLWQKRHDQFEQLTSASEIAMTAMKQAAELGTLVNFSRDLTRVNSLEELAHISHEMLEHYGLNGVFRFYDDIYSGEITPSPLEVDLLMVSSDAPRIMEHGRRALYNSPQASVLIRNHPIDDPDLTGRLRDHLAIFIETLDDKVQSILLRKDTQEQGKALVQNSIKGIQTAAATINFVNMELESRIQDIKSSGREKLNDVLSHMALDAVDHSVLSSAIEELFEQFHYLEANTTEMNETVNQLLEAMKDILEQ